MTSRSILIIIFILLEIPTFSQEINDKIYWDIENELCWEDFKGRAHKYKDLNAITNSGFSVEYKKIDNELHLNARAFMNTKKSWVLNNSKSEDLLLHEQGHFNITEIFIRKYKKVLSETKLKSRKNKFVKQMDDIYANIKLEWDLYQDLYDKETNHSKNELEQAKWILLIDSELKELELFSSQEIILELN